LKLLITCPVVVLLELWCVTPYNYEPAVYIIFSQTQDIYYLCVYVDMFPRYRIRSLHVTYYPEYNRQLCLNVCITYVCT